MTRTGSGPGPAPRRPGHGLRGAARPGPAPGLPSPPSRPGTFRALPLTAAVLSLLSRGALRELPSLPLAALCSRWSLCSPASLDARPSPQQGSSAAWRSREHPCLSPGAGLAKHAYTPVLCIYWQLPGKRNSGVNTPLLLLVLSLCSGTIPAGCSILGLTTLLFFSFPPRIS